MGEHQVEKQSCAVCDLMERLPPEIQEKIFLSLPEDVRQVCLEGRLSFTEDRTVSLPGLAGRTVRLFVAAHGGWVGLVIHYVLFPISVGAAGWGELRAVAGAAGAGERGDPGAGGLGGQADVLTGRQDIHTVLFSLFQFLFYILCRL